MTSLMRGNQSFAVRSESSNSIAPSPARVVELHTPTTTQTILHACWRLGDRSSVVISIQREHEHSNALELLVRRNGTCAHYSGTMVSGRDGDELRMTFIVERVVERADELSRVASSDASVVDGVDGGDARGDTNNASIATLDVLSTPGANAPLLITNLPQRLGLLGGSYTLERIETMEPQ